MNKINELQIIFNQLLERFLQTSSRDDFFVQNKISDYLKIRNSLDFNKIFSSKSQSQLIIDLYQDLNQLNKNFLSDNSKEIFINNKFIYKKFRKLGWQYGVIHFLQKQVDRNLNKFVKCFLVHGSFATKDFISNWSDFDTKIILKNTILKNVDSLNYARKQFSKLSLLCDKIDPLCHHRFSFLTEFDLNYYPNFFLPLIVYQNSLVLFGESKFKINVREDKKEKNQQLVRFINYFKNKISSGKYSRNQTHWKDDLSHLLLWPSLMLQARNIFVYKKYSFQKVKKKFVNLDFSVIDYASQSRKDWFRFNLLKYYPNFLFNFLPYRLNQIIVNQHRKFLDSFLFKVNQKEIEHFTKKALLFLEESFNYLKNET